MFVRVSPVLNLHVGGRIIGTTGEHPFWVDGQGWVEAGRLRIGDVLVSHDGRRLPVEGIADSGRVETVYNLEVEDDHTYFVGTEGWGFSVWSHNTGCNPITQAASQRVKRRVNELNKAIPDQQRGRVTMAAAVAKNGSGKQVVLIGTSEPRGYLRPGVKLKRGEIMVAGAGHAEQNIIAYAKKKKLTVQAIGATRPVCEKCVKAIGTTRAIIAAKLK